MAFSLLCPSRSQDYLLSRMLQGQYSDGPKPHRSPHLTGAAISTALPTPPCRPPHLTAEPPSPCPALLPSALLLPQTASSPRLSQAPNNCIGTSSPRAAGFSAAAHPSS
uniref:Uncharacterized protein n=1 Tax=Oryza rufipogon TaxID=4529 RepID=A0A0E0N7X7_ORYRU